ncbi:MAG TPA: nuclear transport factor 2 family protein [Actinomycetota bacterium]|nr:nuclear transport factor 2 family protein [Actinomycetota bacterium]
MVDSERYEDWVERYIGAWNSNDRQAIGDLFTSDAEYLPVPFGDGWRGREAIVEQWLGRKDEPGDTRFKYEILAATAEIGFVKGHTHYVASGDEYYNLWEVTLDDDGRCSRFVEWWMQPPK